MKNKLTDKQEKIFNLILGKLNLKEYFFDSHNYEDIKDSIVGCDDNVLEHIEYIIKIYSQHKLPDKQIGYFNNIKSLIGAFSKAAEDDIAVAKKIIESAAQDQYKHKLQLSSFINVLNALASFNNSEQQISKEELKEVFKNEKEKSCYMDSFAMILNIYNQDAYKTVQQTLTSLKILDPLQKLTAFLGKPDMLYKKVKKLHNKDIDGFGVYNKLFTLLENDIDRERKLAQEYYTKLKCEKLSQFIDLYNVIDGKDQSKQALEILNGFEGIKGSRHNAFTYILRSIKKLEIQEEDIYFIKLLVCFKRNCEPIEIPFILEEIKEKKTNCFNAEALFVMLQERNIEWGENADDFITLLELARPLNIYDIKTVFYKWDLVVKKNPNVSLADFVMMTSFKKEYEKVKYNSLGGVKGYYSDDDLMILIKAICNKNGKEFKYLNDSSIYTVIEGETYVSDVIDARNKQLRDDIIQGALNTINIILNENNREVRFFYPVNSGQHWYTLEVHIDPRNEKVEIFYRDSNSARSKEDSFVSVFKKRLEEGLKYTVIVNAEIYPIQVISYGGANNNYCGGYTAHYIAENLLLKMQHVAKPMQKGVWGTNFINDRYMRIYDHHLVQHYNQDELDKYAKPQFEDYNIEAGDYNKKQELVNVLEKEFQVSDNRAVLQTVRECYDIYSENNNSKGNPSIMNKALRELQSKLEEIGSKDYLKEYIVKIDQNGEPKKDEDEDLILNTEYDSDQIQVLLEFAMGEFVKNPAKKQEKMKMCGAAFCKTEEGVDLMKVEAEVRELHNQYPKYINSKVETLDQFEAQYKVNYYIIDPIKDLGMREIEAKCALYCLYTLKSLADDKYSSQLVYEEISREKCHGMVAVFNKPLEGNNAHDHSGAEGFNYIYNGDLLLDIAVAGVQFDKMKNVANGMSHKMQMIAESNDKEMKAAAIGEMLEQGCHLYTGWNGISHYVCNAYKFTLTGYNLMIGEVSEALCSMQDASIKGIKGVLFQTVNLLAYNSVAEFTSNQLGITELKAMKVAYVGSYIVVNNKYVYDFISKSLDVLTSQYSIPPSEITRKNIAICDGGHYHNATLVHSCEKASILHEVDGVTIHFGTMEFSDI